MKILLYSTNDGQAVELEDKISDRLNSCDVTICKGFESLNKILRKIYSFSALVLMVTNKEELLELLTIQSELEDSKIILVLPDNSADMIQFALKLYPRYLAESTDDYTTITSVLKKIYS